MSDNFIIKEDFSLANNPVNETLFHTANGYIGLRGHYEEGLFGQCESIPGSYINAF